MNKPKPNDVTISDILRLALPLKTAVMGDPSGTRQNVYWVVLLTTWNHLEDQIKDGDLAIVPPHLQAEISESQFRRNLQSVAQLKIAGLLCFKTISQVTSETANKLSLPILVVPQTIQVREAHQAITSLLLDRQRATSERAMQLYRQLSDMSREGKGLQAMTDMMSKLTGNIVVVQDKRLEIQAASWPHDTAVNNEAITREINKREALPSILRNRKAAAKARQSYWQQILPIENMARLVSPIVSGDRARGYLSIIGPAGSLDMLDSLTAEQGAAACALEMAKAKAVSEAKKSLRGDFLEGLLAGTLPATEIKRLEGRLDHDTKEPHAIMIFSWIGTKTPSIRRMETTISWLMTNHTRPALVHVYGGQHICVFQALKDPTDMETAHEFSRRFREQIAAEFPKDIIIGGMSGPAETLEDWPRVYSEALQAMQVGKRLHLSNQIVEFNSLGVYQLLCELEDNPIVQQFTQQIIDPLAQYDVQHRGSLVQTISAYFDHHGNISQTAESLFVHRNTLLYRIDRIQELTGQDLTNADMRLSLHLALKFWQLRPDTNIT
ncbi:MAG: helix-turn-helix domain-containing protein [Anaerolineales bacterium]|nr:helix-turn-helix domain-containing protein [Anaerolineales bacterium]